MCREARSKNCCTFERSKEILLTSGGETSQKYVASFIGDYLGMSKIMAGFFNGKISKELKEKSSFEVKSYQKSKKNRPQVVNKTLKNRRHFQYQMNGIKRHFYPRVENLQ